MLNWLQGTVLHQEGNLAKEKSRIGVGKKPISTSSAEFQEHSGPFGYTVCMTPIALLKGLQVVLLCFVHAPTIFLPVHKFNFFTSIIINIAAQDSL